MYSNAAEEKQLLTAYQGFARTHTHRIISHSAAGLSETITPP